MEADAINEFGMIQTIEAQAAEIERLRATLSERVGELQIAVCEVERLRLELAGRDAEIAAWLMAEADRLRLAHRLDEKDALQEAATAIASGEYRKGEG